MCATILPGRKLHVHRWLLHLAIILALAGCASSPSPPQEASKSKIVCDSYIILDMCVRDLSGDETVDMVYFSDTNEIFMYQDGQKDAVAEVMPFHRCAVPLNPGMQDTTNRILNRNNLSLQEELGITRELIRNYVAAKPEIDACNAQFEDGDSDDTAQEDEFFMGDSDWDDE